MRRVAPYSSFLVVGCVALGCSTMHPASSQHPGIIELPPGAITRTFPNSATITAERMVDVMSQEAILENVGMIHDSANRECRNFTKADRQALGISLLTPANDVNFDIKAKCKDGQPIAVAVRLKGESGSEVSVLYGFGGDPDLSRDLLDKLEAVLSAPGKDNALAKTAGSKPPTRKAAQP